LEAIYNAEHSLKEFTDPSTFKSYDELKVNLTRVLGEGGHVTTSAEAVDLENTVVSPMESAPNAAAPSESSDDTMSYFAKLAAEA
jgi:hypothetical protein